MHKLEEQMVQRIVAGLQRRSLTSPSRWAERCRIMGPPFPGPWTFKHHPWLKEMHDSPTEINVGQKCSQVGFTETVLNLTFFNMDVKGVDCLYVLPAKTPDSKDFSLGRFDPALELSPHLANMFSDVKNVGHKRAGSANLYVRGSRSRSGLKSVPVGFIVLDEVDEMNQKNIPLAMERTAGQMEWQAWLISTPTLPDVGINLYYRGSTEEEFFFKCPSCSRLINLEFPQCIEITAEDKDDPKIINSFYKCQECKSKLYHQSKIEWLSNGIWVPRFSDQARRGFHINQMYSMAASGEAAKIAQAYLAGKHDPTAATEFHNSKMGETYVDSNAQLTEADIAGHIESYKNGALRPTRLVTAGVDVGASQLHVEIDQWTLGEVQGADLNTNSRPQVLWIGIVPEFDDIDRLMRLWGIHFLVIDANPERRSALQLANRFFGLIKLCQYGHDIHGKDIHASKDEEHLILVNRTSWMDLALSRFKRDEMIAIPADTPFDYKYQLKVPIRVYKKDKNGNNYGYYDSRNKDDHYAHSRTYSEIALKFAASMRVNRDLRSPI